MIGNPRPLLSGRQQITDALVSRGDGFPAAADNPGASVLGPDGRVYQSIRWPTSSDPFVWKSASDVATDVVAGAIVAQATDLLVTVGAGGTYATLNAALAVLSRRQTGVRSAGGANPELVIEIKILAGTTLAEQILFQNVSLGHIRITSEDAVVPVNAAGFVAWGGVISFIVANGSTLPQVWTKFSLTAAPANTYGINLYEGSRIVMRGAMAGAVMRPAGLIGATYNFNMESEASAQLNDCDFDNAAWIGIRAITNSNLGLYNTNAKGCAGVGMYANLGTHVAFFGGGTGQAGYGGAYRNDFRKTPGVDTSGASSDLRLESGGMVSIAAAPTEFRGGWNMALNTLTSHGVVFRA